MIEHLPQLGVALALGLGVGLQREWAKASFAGIRTFPLFTLLGFASALLSQTHGGWVLAAGILAAAVIVFLGDLGRLQRDEEAIRGVTTEVAAILMFAVGALCVTATLWVPIAIAGVVVVLLQYKGPLHAFVQAIEAGELRGVAQFALIGMIILPLMPDTTVGPYQVVNPRHAWTMVVLIVGISLVGHAARRVLGQRMGVVANGLLGGLVSSTATTVSEARRTGPDQYAGSTIVIVLATMVSFARLLLEIGVAAHELLPTAGPPLGAFLGVSVLVGIATVLYFGRQQHPQPEPDDATDLIGATIFGLLYAGALLFVAFTEHQFGEDALYAVGFISGLTDVDAITLSTSHLAVEGKVEHGVAWRVILIAAISNTLFKLGITAVMGGWGLAWRAGLAIAPALGAGGLIFWLWPS